MKKIFICLAMALATSQSQAALITSASGISSPTVIDFSDKGQQFTTGPTQVGGLVGQDVVFTASGPSGGFSYDGYGLVANGTWGSGMTYAFIDNGDGASIRFAFNSGLVSAVGGFLNYAPGYSGELLIRALDTNFNVLEEYNINQLAAISTPGELNGGAFRGISRANADIYAFELVGGVGVIDDLTFSAVPVPAAVWLFGSGLMGLVGMARRQAA